MRNKRLLVIVVITVLILVMPLIAMQFSDEVKWSYSDFLVAGILLLGTGLLFEFALRKVKKTRQRIVICAAILATLFLIWIELAVGIFGTPIAGS